MRKFFTSIGIGCAGLAFACSEDGNTNELLFDTADDSLILNSTGASATQSEVETKLAQARLSTDPKVNVNLVWPSSGCGMPLPAEQVPTEPGSRVGYTKYTVMETGETITGHDQTRAVARDIYVRVPFDYDPNKPYRVIYIGQGCGGGSGDQNTYPLFDESKGGDEQAIYVGISLPPARFNGGCYDNRAGEASLEWEAFEIFHTLVESKYCADNNRVFVSGYSSGGWLASMWGCYFDGLNPSRKFAPKFRIRGQASTTGCQPDNIGQLCADTNHNVAGFWLHDFNDPANPYACNHEVSLPRVLANNACTSSASEPWGEGALADVCLRYTDCPAEYPVVFCTTNCCGHSDQPDKSIPGYTQFFHLLDPAP